MSKYYRLKLNCARSSTEYDDGYSYDEIGYVAVLPVNRWEKIKKRRFLSSKEEIVRYTEYNGIEYIIAELVEDYFVDLITDKKIYYDENSIKDVRTSTVEELKNEIKKGPSLSCFSYTEVTATQALKYMKEIKNTFSVYKKYLKEISIIEDKTLLINEINRREQIELEKQTKESEAEALIRQMRRK